jgi:hypothetical protein
VDIPLSLGLPFLRERGPSILIRTTYITQIVTAKDVLDTAAIIKESLSDRVPGVIKMLPDKQEVNPAAFLYTMAQEFRSIYNKGEPKPVLLTNAEVVPQSITNEQGIIREEAQGRILTREMPKPDWLNLLQLWTLGFFMRNKYAIIFVRSCIGAGKNILRTMFK